MSFPIVLSSGTVAVYGAGVSGQMPSGAIIEPNQRFGTVYHIWDGGQSYVYGGDVVYWKEGEQLGRLATAEGIYTILPARLVTMDNEIFIP